jgi:hypothetical protein
MEILTIASSQGCSDSFVGSVTLGRIARGRGVGRQFSMGFHFFHLLVASPEHSYQGPNGIGIHLRGIDTT